MITMNSTYLAGTGRFSPNAKYMTECGDYFSDVRPLNEVVAWPNFSLPIKSLDKERSSRSVYNIQLNDCKTA